MPRRMWGSIGAVTGALSLLLGPLVVRADPAAATTYVVQAGETLSQIALDAGVDGAALAALNGLDDPNFLVVGQSLTLPAAVAARPAAAANAAVASPAASPVAASGRSYAVVEGDTLWAIAQQFGTTTDALVQLNNLDDPSRLVAGAVLTVPGGQPSAASPVPTPRSTRAGAAGAPVRRSVLVPYTVQPGETLNQIARQFDVRADAITQASGLDDPNKLSIGSVLKVPLPGKEHVVSAGETLRDIALSEKVDLGSLIDFNQLDDPELIRVGQMVLLPVAANQQAATSAAAPAVAAPTASAAAAASSPAPPVAVVAAAAPAAVPPSAAKPVAAPPGPPKPAAPVNVVAPPKGAPTDGLAGGGLKLLGAPYVYGGSNPSGFDCSGFVWYVARQAGKQLSRGMLGEYNAGSHPGRDELKAGDLVFFQNTYSPGLSHNGIYIGNGQFVHAADEAAGVTVSSLNTAYWSSHWFGATRLP